MIVYHAEVIEQVQTIDVDRLAVADTIGIYESQSAAEAACVRYEAARLLEEPDADYELMIHEIEVGKDLIYSQQETT